MRKSLVLVLLCLAASRAEAQVKTTVSDTIHNNDGSLANGTVKITNPATFTAADGTVVAQNMYVLTTVINGALGVSLIPNAGSNPTGTYYVVQYNLSSGAVFTEYWIVPTPPPSTVNLLAVRTLGPPATAFAIPFNQLNPPPNCQALGGIPQWTGTQWTCTTSVVNSFQTNGTNNSSQTILNLQNGAASDGVSVSFSNPSAGNVQAALSGLPTLSAAGDTLYWNGSALARFAGNSSGTACFSENASGVPAWAACALGGTNTYTSSQTATTADSGKLIKLNCSSACTYTLPNPQPSITFFTTVESVGSTLATVALGSSMTFNGGSTLPSLASNTLLVVFADTQTSTNYAGNAGAVAAGSNTQIQYNNNGAFGATAALATSVVGGTTQNLNVGSTSAGTFGRVTIVATGSNPFIGGDTSVANQLDASGGFSAANYVTATNCSSSGGTCGSAASGAVSIAAAASTVTVATTAVSANSDISLTRNDALGTRLGVTCNTATAAGDIKVTTITAGTSFVITVQNAPATNPLCLTYWIVN